MRRACGLVLIVIGVACEDAPPPMPAPSAPGGVGDCATRTSRLTARLAALPAPSLVAPVEASDAADMPVSARGLNVIEAGSTLWLGPPARVDGVELAGADDGERAAALAEQWRRAGATAAILGRPPPQALYVVGGSSDAVDRALGLVAKLPDVELRLLVRPSTTPPRPPAPPVPPHLADLLDRDARIDPSTRAQRIAAAVTAATGTCAALGQVFAALAGVRSEDRSALLRQGVAEGLQSCNCQGVDVDSLEALLFAVLDPGPPVAWVPFPRTAQGTLAALAAGAPTP